MRKSILSIALSVAVLTLFLTLSTISIAGVANDPVILTGDDALTEPGDRGWTPLEQDRPDGPWITKWYMPGRYMNNGGFATSGPIDVVKDASGGALTQESLSTVDGSSRIAEINADEPSSHITEPPQTQSVVVGLLSPS